jgi:hypothetical protein
MATEDIQPQVAEPVPQAAGLGLTVAACVAGALFPGLGHAILRRWDRAVVFMGSICLMFFIGLGLHARLFNPDFSDFFAILKFLADAGSGLLYWVCWLRGLGPGEPSAYAYDFGNVFVFVAGLLNMLVVVDVFDIALGRKP